MKKLLLLVCVLLMVSFPAQARYKCETNSATDEVKYIATKMKDNFSKVDMIEFGKITKRNGDSIYYVIPAFSGKGFGKTILADVGTINVDGDAYTVTKDTNASHITWKNYKPRSIHVLAEYVVPTDIAEKIITSSGVITFEFEIEGRGKKILDFGLKTSDEIRFVTNRNFEDYRAVSKKELVPQYTEKEK